MALSWRHHAVIQALMSKGPLTESQMHQLLGEVLEGGDKDSELTKINASLGVLQLEVRQGRDQSDGSVWFSIVNRAADKEAELGTKYSHQQLQLFRAIVERIVQRGCGHGVMRGLEVHHLATQPAGLEDSSQLPSSSQRVAAPKSLTGSEKEKTVEQLVQDKWLAYCSLPEHEQQEEPSERGRRRRLERAGGDGDRSGIRLGVRTFLELRQLLKSIEGASICAFCGDAAVEGRGCMSEDCDAVLHLYCEQAKFSQETHAKCPSCGVPWLYDGPLLPSPPEAGAGQRTQRAGKSKRPKR